MNNINSNTYFRYLRQGLSLRPIRGKCDALEDLDYAFSIYVEGVQYVLNDFGEFEETNDPVGMIGCIDNLEQIANSSRHDYVNYIKNYIQLATQKDVWCMVGADSQLMVTFGNEDGYVAQLIMDFASPEKFEEFKSKMIQSLIQLGIPEDKMPEIQDIEEFVLIPAEPEFNAMFSTANFNLDGVVVEFFDEDNDDPWEDDEDDDI